MTLKAEHTEDTDGFQRHQDGPQFHQPENEPSYAATSSKPLWTYIIEHCCCQNAQGTGEPVQGTGLFDERVKQQEEFVTFETDAGTYQGEWQGNVMQGRGKLNRFDGSVYEGDFEGGYAQGQGRLTTAEGHVYEGQWDQDSASGHGLYLDANGEYYEGGWTQNLKNGTGVQMWKDGQSYEGDFQNGKKHGEGIFKYKTGLVAYKGQFFDNQMHGKGTYQFNDGRHFTGDFQYGQMHGRGVMEWQNGNKYVGEFRDGKRDGNGELYFSDGSAFHGQWVKNKQHGTGTSIDADGVKVQGQWLKGAMVSPMPAGGLSQQSSPSSLKDSDPSRSREERRRKMKDGVTLSTSTLRDGEADEAPVSPSCMSEAVLQVPTSPTPQGPPRVRGQSKGSAVEARQRTKAINDEFEVLPAHAERAMLRSPRAAVGAKPAASPQASPRGVAPPTAPPARARARAE